MNDLSDNTKEYELELNDNEWIECSPEPGKTRYWIRFDGEWHEVIDGP